MMAGGGREPFLDILRRALRWGGFGALGVYMVGVLTDNPSLYMGAPLGGGVASAELEELSVEQLNSIYQKELGAIAHSEAERANKAA